MWCARDITEEGKHDLWPSNTFQTPKFLFYENFFLVINDSMDMLFYHTVDTKLLSL